MRLTAKGRLFYDPIRQDFKKQHKMRTLIVQLPRDDLDLYYQWFIEKNFGQSMKLQRPMYGAHVTIVGGNERVPNMAAWKKHQNEEIVFEYDPVVRNHWQFWSLPVYCKRFDEIRAELGMKLEPDFHITIGRQFDWQPVSKTAKRRASEIRRSREIEESWPS